MKWFLDVAYLGIAAGWKWALAVMVVIGILIGSLFAAGVLGGGDDSGTPGPIVDRRPTPVPTATPTLAPDPTPTSVPTVVPTSVPSPTPTAVLLREIAVPVLLEGAANVGSLEFVLVYEPSVLEVTSVETGALASDALLDSSTGTPGRLWAGMADADGITGDGPAAIITFAVIGSADSSTALTLESVVAYDVVGRLDIITEASAGRFAVKDGSLTAPILGFLP